MIFIFVTMYSTVSSDLSAINNFNSLKISINFGLEFKIIFLHHILYIFGL